jgi:hypothetical protein
MIPMVMEQIIKKMHAPLSLERKRKMDVHLFKPIAFLEEKQQESYREDELRQQ